MARLLILCTIAFALVALPATVNSHEKKSMIEEAKEFIAQDGNATGHGLKQLVSFLDKHGAGDCLGRISCELQRDMIMNGYRRPDVPMWKNLKCYRTNPTTGYLKRFAEWCESDFELCKIVHHKCNHNLSEILDVGNIIMTNLTRVA